jgi:resuscitation-promoting factor RpfB
LLVFTLLMSGCQRPAEVKQVFIEVDHGRHVLNTDVATVRDALAQAEIELGELDRVEPDLYVQIGPEMTIRVIRVAENIEVERVTLPFERQVVVNEALPNGERRLVQLGANGEEEVTIRVVREDGVEVERTEISRISILEPIDEIIVVGAEGRGLASVPVEGAIAYLAGGNAWVMRDSNRARRPLTTEGDLDGRVFSLAADGRTLAYTRRLEGDLETPLNQLWMVSTTVVGERPISLPVQGALYAQWSPVVTDTRLAYSTFARVASSPGWRANNDLWLLDVSAQTVDPVEVRPPNAAGIYSWWGTSFKWSPDGSQMAYARADQVGVIDFLSGRDRVLLDFAPVATFGDWVWIPGIDWSPNGQFIAATGHGLPLASESPEESPVFDLWLLATTGSLQARVAEQVGMWSGPSWGQAGLVFGQAESPLASVDSRYQLRLIDHDGSNNQPIFPTNQGLGVQLPEIVWSPSAKEIVFVNNGNLFLLKLDGTPARQLTTDGQASHPLWAAPRSRNSEEISLTARATVTATLEATQQTTPEAAPTLQTEPAGPPVRATPPVIATGAP